MSRGMQMYRPYVLAEAGLARAHELEAIDEHFPPQRRQLIHLWCDGLWACFRQDLPPCASATTSSRTV